MKKILLDTNFFLVPFQMGVNIMTEFERIMEEPFELMTISTVKKELESLARNGKGDDKACAKLATELARNIRVEEYPGDGDDSILVYARLHKDTIVATNDSTLRKRLRGERVQTIFVRNRSKLEIE
jgi:hypothetical protein